MNDLHVAKGLGAFSLALGLTAVAAPDWLGRQTGTRLGAQVSRVLGAREIASGVGVLAAKDPAPALWSRVFGDVVDLGMLAREWRWSERRSRVLVAMAAVGAVTALNLVFARRLQRASPDVALNPSRERTR